MCRVTSPKKINDISNIYNYCKKIVFFNPVAEYNIIVPSDIILKFPVLYSQKFFHYFFTYK